jgi:hypothetical protein
MNITRAEQNEKRKEKKRERDERRCRIRIEEKGYSWSSHRSRWASPMQIIR